MLRPRWRKVLSDLWDNKVRTLLVVASIAVGVFAIGVIAGTYVIIAEDLNRSYAAINPANIDMLTRPFNRDFVETIRHMDTVAESEGRREVTVRLQVAPDKWDTLTLVAIPDYEDMRIFQHLLMQGVPVPQNQEVVLEHKSLTILEASVGDTLEVELPDGSTRSLPIVGAIQDQSDVYGSILGDLMGYITFDTLEWLGQPANLNRLYVTVAQNPNDDAHIRQVAKDVSDRLERNGLEIYRTLVSPRDEHPLESIIQALLSVLIILGVLIVFLSGSLIANTMSALLNQHLRQIGVMKLVGGRRTQVISMYIVLIMGFGILALLISVPLGSLAAYRLSRFVAHIINFDLQDFRIVPQAIIFQVIIALLIPPAAGILPVLKGSRITVQKAISTKGLGSYQGRKGWINRQLERFRFLSHPLLISLRNTFRRKGRLLLTLLTLTLGGAVFIAVFNSQVSLDFKMEQVTRYFGADVNLDFAQSYRIEEITQQALAVPGVERVEVWNSTSADILHADGTPPDSLIVIAPPADSELVDPTLLEGRWLLPGDENALAISSVIWNDYPGLKAGDTLRLELNEREEDWVVVGIFQYTGLDEMIAYANYDYVSKVLKQAHRSSVYRIVTTEHSLAFQREVGARLDTYFRDRGFKVSEAEAGKAFNASVTDVLGILTAVLLVMALMTALVGSIGLTGTMSMNVMERTREIGVMRAVGAHNQIVTQLVIVEGLIIGAISYVLGVALSFPISTLLSNVISLAIFNSPADTALTITGFGIWLVVVLFLSVLASLLPARNASQLTIREVLAYE